MLTGTAVASPEYFFRMIDPSFCFSLVRLVCDSPALRTASAITLGLKLIVTILSSPACHMVNEGTSEPVSHVPLYVRKGPVCTKKMRALSFLHAKSPAYEGSFHMQSHLFRVLSFSHTAVWICFAFTVRYTENGHFMWFSLLTGTQGSACRGVSQISRKVRHCPTKQSIRRTLGAPGSKGSGSCV